MIKKFTSMLLSAAVALSVIAASPAAYAQPSVGYTAPAQLRTYRAAIVALTPAASGTDFFTIAGVSGHQVRIRSIHCDGTSTAAASNLIQVIERSTLNTAGTSTAPTIVPLNSNQLAASAVVKAYTANPTLGTSVGVVAEGYLTTGTAASSAFNNNGITFSFENQNMFLNSATTLLAVNANATSFSAGASISCWIEWNEV